MFKVLFAAALLLGPPAFAEGFDAEGVSSAWREAHAVCRGTIDPGPTTPEQACQDRQALTDMLKMHDYCLDDAEQEWIKCRLKP